MKKSIIFIIIAIAIFSFVIPYNTYATMPDEIIETGKSWLEVGRAHTNGTIDSRNSQRCYQ